MIECFLAYAFEVLSFLFRSTVLKCGARLPINTLNYTGQFSQWCPFSNWGWFECDIAHCRSVVIQCMLYKIKCNPMNHIYGALHVSYVPVRVSRGAFVAYQYTYAPRHCRTSQYRRTFIPISMSMRYDLADTVFDVEGLGGFKVTANTFWVA